VVASARRVSDLAGLHGVETVALDVADGASVEAAARSAGPLDVVINNAAMSVQGPIEAVPPEVCLAMFDTNVVGPLRVMQAFLPGMRARGSGLIINVSSLAGQFAPPLQGVYAASKRALELLSEAARFEVRPFGVRVVIAEFGAVGTEMLARTERFTSASYTPLVQQVEARQQAFTDRRRGVPPEQAAGRIAELLERRDLPLRVVLGGVPERALARLGGRLIGRLAQLGLSW
jgi:NAD(P)-dependent dehydrogenase (short-subunit alcohol dehydrogenase family)